MEELLSKKELDDWLLEKYHANLIEAGKINRRLTWIVFILGAFFTYLALTFDSQPTRFTLGFGGQLGIDKLHLVISSPYIIAILNLASAVIYLYSKNLHSHIVDILSKTEPGQGRTCKDFNYLLYPSFEYVLLNLAATTPSSFSGSYLGKFLHGFYHLSVRGMPFIIQLFLLVAARAYSTSPTLDKILLFSLILSVLALYYSLKDFRPLTRLLDARLIRGTRARFFARTSFEYAVILAAALLFSWGSTSVFGLLRLPNIQYDIRWSQAMDFCWTVFELRNDGGKKSGEVTVEIPFCGAPDELVVTTSPDSLSDRASFTPDSLDSHILRLRIPTVEPNETIRVYLRYIGECLGDGKSVTVLIKDGGYEQSERMQDDGARGTP